MPRVSPPGPAEGFRPAGDRLAVSLCVELVELDDDRQWLQVRAQHDVGLEPHFLADYDTEAGVRRGDVGGDRLLPEAERIRAGLNLNERISSAASRTLPWRVARSCR